MNGRTLGLCLEVLPLILSQTNKILPATAYIWNSAGMSLGLCSNIDGTTLLVLPVVQLNFHKECELS